VAGGWPCPPGVPARRQPVCGRTAPGDRRGDCRRCARSGARSWRGDLRRTGSDARADPHHPDRRRRQGIAHASRTPLRPHGTEGRRRGGGRGAGPVGRAGARRPLRPPGDPARGEGDVRRSVDAPPAEGRGRSGASRSAFRSHRGSSIRILPNAGARSYSGAGARPGPCSLCGRCIGGGSGPSECAGSELGFRAGLDHGEPGRGSATRARAHCRHRPRSTLSYDGRHLVARGPCPAEGARSSEVIADEGAWSERAWPGRRARTVEAVGRRRASRASGRAGRAGWRRKRLVVRERRSARGGAYGPRRPRLPQSGRSGGEQLLAGRRSRGPPGGASAPARLRARGANERTAGR
jgi:hypothetical protein